MRSPIENWRRKRADRNFNRQVAPLHEIIRALNCEPCRVHKIEPISLTEVRLVFSCSPSNEIVAIRASIDLLTDEIFSCSTT